MHLHIKNKQVGHNQVKRHMWLSPRLYRNSPLGTVLGSKLVKFPEYLKDTEYCKKKFTIQWESLHFRGQKWSCIQQLTELQIQL